MRRVAMRREINIALEDRIVWLNCFGKQKQFFDEKMVLIMRFSPKKNLRI